MPSSARRLCVNKVRLCSFALLLALWTDPVWSACTTNEGITAQRINMNVGQVIVRPDAAIGQVLARKEFSIRKVDPIATCDWRGGRTIGEMLQGQASGTVKDTYTTNVPGIGVRLARRFDGKDTFYPHFITYRPPGRGLYLAPGYFTVEIIKIGSETGSGSLAAGQYTTYYPDGSGPSRPLLVTELTANAITIVSSACFVDAGSRNIAVNFDSMYRGRFTGVGSTHQTREFDVQLTCSGPSAGRDVVKLSFDYTPDPANVPGVIRLDGGAGSASGVGIQLLTANGEPIRQQQPLTVATLDTPDLRTVTVPLQARYYQTAPAVQAGDTQARATFTIEYN